MNPSSGKTVFIAVALVKFLGEKQEIAFDVGESSYLLFNDTGVFLHPNRRALHPSEGR
jgi:hypothetical protein